MDGRMGRTQESSSTIQIIPVSWEKERAAVARNSENSGWNGNLSESWKVQRRLKEGWKGHSGWDIYESLHSVMLKILDWKIFLFLISEHALLPPVRKPSQLTVGQLPFTSTAPPSLSNPHPCQGLCMLTALKTPLIAQPFSLDTTSHPTLRAPGYSSSSTSLLSSAVRHLSPVLFVPTQQYSSDMGAFCFTEDKALGCLQLFTSTHHQPAVLERMEDFFLFIYLFFL